MFFVLVASTVDRPSSDIGAFDDERSNQTGNTNPPNGSSDADDSRFADDDVIDDDDDDSGDEDEDTSRSTSSGHRGRVKDADRPSAARLAKRLYHLDGFRRADISPHLSKKLVLAGL